MNLTWCFGESSDLTKPDRFLYGDMDCQKWTSYVFLRGCVFLPAWWLLGDCKRTVETLVQNLSKHSRNIKDHWSLCGTFLFQRPTASKSLSFTSPIESLYSKLQHVGKKVSTVGTFSLFKLKLQHSPTIRRVAFLTEVTPGHTHATDEITATVGCTWQTEQDPSEEVGLGS